MKLKLQFEEKEELKEEISSKLYPLLHARVDPYELDKCIDEILKIIIVDKKEGEKKSIRKEIDEAIDKYRLSLTSDIIIEIFLKGIDSTIPNQSTTTGYLWSIGFNDALRQVKEMLK